MRKTLAPVSLAIFLTLLAGCSHKEVAAPEPAPPALLQPQATVQDLPNVPPPATPTVKLGAAVVAETPPPPAPKKTHSLRHHPRTGTPASTPSDTASTDSSAAAGVTQPTEGAPAPPAAPASTGQEPPATTPIGQLSAAPNPADVPSKQSIQEEIDKTETGLNRLHRTLTNEEQETVSEIRTFISKAKNALQAGDLDGAHTLTVKARVLLAELGD
jgi:ribosomal protein S20